jgi:HK97 family phage major capsid protein
MSDAIKNLAEKRAALLTDASGIVAEHAEKGEALSAEAQARFDALTAEAAVLNSAISSEKIAAEARAAADVARAEKAVAFAPATDATRNLSAELRRIAREGGEVELRDVTKSTFTQAVEQGDRFWITAGQVNPFVDPAVVTVLQVAKGNVIALPRTTALGTAAAVNEGSAIGESDGTNSSLSLTPVKYASLLQVGIETVQDQMFDVASWATEKLAAELAVAHGAVAGPAVAAAATVGKQGAAVAPTYAELLALIYSVKQQARRAAKRGFLMNDTTLGAIMGLVDGASRPIFVPGDQTRPDTILGFPVYSAALADNGDEALSIAFGDLGAIYTVVAGAPAISADTSFAFGTGLITYRGILRGATGLIDPNAVKTFKGANV